MILNLSDVLSEQHKPIHQSVPIEMTCFPLHQTFNLQVARPYPVHWRNHTAQHMIKSPVLLRCFNCHYITNVLHHTNSRSVPLRIGTNLAYFGIGYIMAYFTILHLTFQSNNRIPESFHRSRILPKQMQHKPHGRFTPDTGKFGKFADCLFKQHGRILLVHR